VTPPVFLSLSDSASNPFTLEASLTASPSRWTSDASLARSSETAARSASRCPAALSIPAIVALEESASFLSTCASCCSTATFSRSGRVPSAAFAIRRASRSGPGCFRSARRSSTRRPWLSWRRDQIWPASCFNRLLSCSIPLRELLDPASALIARRDLSAGLFQLLGKFGRSAGQLVFPLLVVFLRWPCPPARHQASSVNPSDPSPRNPSFEAFHPRKQSGPLPRPVAAQGGTFPSSTASCRGHRNVTLRPWPHPSPDWSSDFSESTNFFKRRASEEEALGACCCLGKAAGKRAAVMAMLGPGLRCFNGGITRS